MPLDPADSLPALLERYERPLVRYAQSILNDLEAARDVVQETFIKYVESWDSRSRDPEPSGNGSSPSSTPARPVEAWLFTVCRNRAIDHRRKQSRIIYMNETIDRASEAPSPGRVLESKETADSLLQLLEQLTDNQRDVIRLKFQNDLSYREIAEITQLSVTNVGFLLHTGLKKLRALAAAAPRDQWPIAQAL